MKNVKFIFLAFALIFAHFVVKSQQSSMRTEVWGYVIDIGDHVLFQPIDSFREFSLEILDNRSFKLGNISSEEIPMESIKNLGDSMSVELVNTKTHKSYTYNCKYFYCAIVLDICIYDTLDKPKYFYPSKYQIYKNGKCYPCYGYFVNNRIIKISPKKKKWFDLYCEFYKKNHYHLPNYLRFDSLYDKKVPSVRDVPQ